MIFEHWTSGYASEDTLRLLTALLRYITLVNSLTITSHSLLWAYAAAGGGCDGSSWFVSHWAPGQPNQTTSAGVFCRFLLLVVLLLTSHT